MKNRSGLLTTLLFFAIISGFFSFRQREVASSAAINEDQRMSLFVPWFLSKYWEMHPVEAVYMGYHINDSIPFVPDSDYFERTAATLQKLTDTLRVFREDRLSASSKTDLWMMRDRISSDLFYLNEFKDYEWNPAWYNIGGEFAEIVNGSYAPLDSRLRSASSRLRSAPAYYEAALNNLKTPTLEHTDLAILQNEGAISIFSQTFPDSIRASGLSKEEIMVLNRRLEAAKLAIEQYVSKLREMRETMTTENSRSFRIGRDLYYKKFSHDICSGYNAGEIYTIAQKRKSEVQSEMAKLAKTLWPKYFGASPMPEEDNKTISQVIERISMNHTAPDSFQLSIEHQIPELIAFINKKGLLWIDPAKPLVVRKTPEYMEGSGAGASISSPGPYDKNGNTYYNVSPLTGYTPEMAESYLREYNRYMLQILSIHEAIPGHYTQLVYANRSPSLIKSLFGNGAMIEGWAVYSERMMLEEGYGNNEPEMWLMYYKWHLRSVCNTILDYEVHVNSWDQERAIKFLTTEAFQQQAEAEGKWRRVKLSQVQLCSYFTGFTEIYNLREEYKKSKGTAYSLKQFNEQFLSYGSTPVRYIRELMLQPK